MKKTTPNKLISHIKSAIYSELKANPEKLPGKKILSDKEFFLTLSENKRRKIVERYKDILYYLPEDIDTYTPEKIYDTIQSTLLMSSSEPTTPPHTEVVKSLFDVGLYKKRLQKHHRDLNEAKYSEDMDQPDSDYEITEQEFAENMERVRELREEIEHPSAKYWGGVNWMDPDKIYQ